MTSKAHRIHVLSPDPKDQAAGIDGMLCGMQSRPERRLIFTIDSSLADCKRCLDLDSSEGLKRAARHVMVNRERIAKSLAEERARRPS